MLGPMMINFQQLCSISLLFRFWCLGHYHQLWLCFRSPWCSSHHFCGILLELEEFLSQHPENWRELVCYRCWLESIYLIEMPWSHIFSLLSQAEGLARSPIFAMLSESLSGISTIRANNAMDYFQQKFRVIHDAHGKQEIASCACHQQKTSLMCLYISLHRAVILCLYCLQ